MNDLRCAVIGTGFWGEFQIAAWCELPGVRIAAVCDRNQYRASQVANRFGVPRVYGEARELLRAESLDFVDIAVGPEFHEELVLLAAEHRNAVICQKPMALDYAACERMVRTCRAAGIMFLVHENYRWQTRFRRVKELLTAGRIGRPFRAHIQFSLGDLGFYDRQPYLYTQPHFALFDMGPHLLDLPRFFFGEPSRLFAQEFKVHPRFAGEDILSVMLSYERLSCHCELSWRTTGYNVFIEGDQGTVTCQSDGRLVLQTAEGETTEQVTAPTYAWADPRYGFAHPSIVATNQNLLAALRGEGVAETTGEDNLKTMRLIDLTLQSIRSQQAMSV
jgi:predicted dehydrogenase